MPPDVRRDIRADVRQISGPKTYSLGCFFVLEINRAFCVQLSQLSFRMLMLFFRTRLPPPNSKLKPPGRWSISVSRFSNKELSATAGGKSHCGNFRNFLAKASAQPPALVKIAKIGKRGFRPFRGQRTPISQCPRNGRFESKNPESPFLYRAPQGKWGFFDSKRPFLGHWEMGVL